MADITSLTDRSVPSLSQPYSGAEAGPIRNSLASIFDQPGVRKLAPIAALFVGLGLAALAWASFQTPSQVPLFQGLADGDKAAIATALQTSGITYELDKTTGSLTVGEGDVHKARMALAAQGLPKAAPSGDALLSALPMGTSRAIEDETLKTARELDLARTIEAIDSVKSARVHLAVSAPSVFVRDEAKSAASVMLTLHQGRSLTNTQVKAIQHLIASSVPGLGPQEVSIVDQSGALLSQSHEPGESQNFDLQLRVEERYRQAIATLLLPIVGEGNFTTEVHVDLDFSESQSTRETYPKEDRALRQEDGNRTSLVLPGVEGAEGIPGATSNSPPQATLVKPSPPPAAVPLASPDKSQSAETYSRTFDVGKEISVTHQPQGKIVKLGIAVALKSGAKPIRQAEIAKMEQLVQSAVGFDPTRGDKVVVSAHSFIQPQATPTNWWDNPLVFPAVRQAAGLLAALLVFLLVARPIIRIFRDRALPDPVADDPSLLEQHLLEAGLHRQAAPELSIEEKTAHIRQFVRDNPQRAALIVKQLLRRDGQNV